MSTNNVTDTARLSLLLNELRLPAIKLLWPQFAEQADKEGWPAARFLVAIAEHELAERDRRRIERHLAEARLLPGKTLDTFAFEAVPMISRAQITAIVAGDAWLEKGANLLLFGPPGGGKRRSMLVTANQPFGEWGKVFPDPAMTLAAIDRLVHHATIFEMNVESYRRREAVERKRGPGRPASYATPANISAD